jgi:hypoxanthine-guanine phosphoribosyltransferase
MCAGQRASDGLTVERLRAGTLDDAREGGRYRSMATEHTELFSAAVIAEAVQELAKSIDHDFRDDGVVVITVMKGAAIFAADLVRAMTTETELVYVTASSYAEGFTPGAR